MLDALPETRAPLPPMFRPQVLIGAASPLWGYFAGATAVGVAFWWMTRWARGDLMGAEIRTFDAAVEAVTRPALDAAVELQRTVEAAAEPVVEAVAEAAGGPLAEALANDQDPAMPVGGEAAPFGAATLEAELIAKPEVAADLAIAREPAAEPEPPPKPKRAAAPEAPPKPKAKRAASPEPPATRPPRARKPRENREAKPH